MDYYEILGVSKEADQSTIKKAYRKMAMKYHPDQNPGDSAAEEKFKEAAEAYDVLSNDDKRTRYDRFGKAGVGGPGGGGHQDFGDINDIFGAFGDIFGDFFGGAAAGGARRGGRQNPRQRGSDLRYFMDIDLKDVISGIKKEVSFEAEGDCKPCSGSGAEKGTSAETCPTCRGSGQVVRQQGFFQMATPCSACSGKGQVIKSPCKPCSGQGRTLDRKKIEVNVPAGVDNGTRLRLTGEGEAGYKGGPAGDLYVEIRVKNNHDFQREGTTLYSQIDVSYLQALLGGKVKFDTLDGQVEITIPKGTQNETTLRVSGKGVPSLKRKSRGDLHLITNVMIPKKLSTKEEALLREIADIKKEKVADKKGFFS